MALPITQEDFASLERARQLLHDISTPKQREEYEGSERFTVIGNVTGNTYLIRRGAISTGNTAYCMVFRLARELLPEDYNTVQLQMYYCDLMIAQKMMVECDEKAFLNIAIRR